MRKTVNIAFLVILAAMLLSVSGASQVPNPVDRPVQVNLTYNNQTARGSLFMVNNEPYVSVEALKSLFRYNDMLDSGSGIYLVNGCAVDKYYYLNYMYLDLVDFCNVLGLRPQISDDRKGVTFSPRKAVTAQSSDQSIRISIKNTTTGTNPDPVNSRTYIFKLGLTNVTTALTNLNHFNFQLVGNSGVTYISLKYMNYYSIYGGNDTPDALNLDPEQEHVLDISFNLPPSDSPAMLVIQKNQQVLGSYKF
jgi:hypothetical protein